MWGRLDQPRMTRAIYDAIGGVEGALEQIPIDFTHSPHA
jgi:hypothetical protein